MYKGSQCADAASRMAGIASTDAISGVATLTVAPRRSTEFSCSQCVRKHVMYSFDKHLISCQAVAQ